MVPLQTSHILIGIAVALLYGGAILATGSLLGVAIVPSPVRTAIRAQGGLPGLVWLGFVLGQGVLGVGWLVLSLAGLLYAQFVWGFCALGWCLGCGMLWVWKQECAEAVQQMWTGLRSCTPSRSWYLWIGIVALVVLNGCSSMGLSVCVKRPQWDWTSGMVPDVQSSSCCNGNTDAVQHAWILWSDGRSQGG